MSQLPRIASSAAPSLQGDASAAAEVPEYPRGINEIQVFKLEPMPSSKDWNTWNIAFKKKVRGGSLKPKEAYEWISAAADAPSWESLADDGAFEALNYKIATALMEICSVELIRKLLLIERQLDALLPPRILNGLQISWMTKQ